MILRADAWAVWLNVLHQTASTVFCPKALSVSRLLGLRVRPMRAHLAGAMEHGQSVRIDDPATDARYNNRVTERVGYVPGSLLLAPLMRRGDPDQQLATQDRLPAFGVISVISEHPSTFTDEDLNVLEALAAAAGGAIQNAQLFSRANEEIEQRRRVERALRHSESQYRTMVETSPDGIVVTDLNGIISNCNLRALQLHGFDHRTDVLGKSVLMLFAPDCRAKLLALHRELVEGLCPRRACEPSILCRTGPYVTVIYTASLVAGEDGNSFSIIGFSHDITDRCQAEDAVRRHNQELKTLNRIATHIAQVRDVNTLLATVLRLVMEVLEVDAGCAHPLQQRRTAQDIGDRCACRRTRRCLPRTPRLCDG